MSSPSFGFYTTAEEVASAYADRVRGKTILITGVTPNGLGLYTAKVLAAHSPRLLILAARSTRTLDAAAAEIRHVAPACPTRSLLLDLASTSTVRVAAENLNSWIDMSDIDILINNAAVMSTPWGLSQDGIEQQFATNHIGHFLFTNLIMDKIIAGKGRIINVSSGAHQFGPVRFDDYNFKNGEEYDPDKAYGQSKTANMLFTVSLALKLAVQGVTAFSLHPGVIFTNLMRHISDNVLQAKGFKDEHGNLIRDGIWKTKTPSQGCATTLVAALDPDIAERSGAYLADCRIDHDNPIAEYAVSTENAEKLWKLSEKLVDQRFEY